MTDTGPVPGEGLPETAGAEAVHQPHADRPVDAAEPPAGPGPVWDADGFHAAATPGYTFLDQQEGSDLPGGVDDDDDVLLMPGRQGSWGDPQPVPPQPPVHHAPVAGVADAGAHEAGGRDMGAMEFGSVRAPDPGPAPSQPTAPRRPLHLGPPVSDPTIGVSVRSLADRGPTPVPIAPAPAAPPQPEPPLVAAPAHPTAGPDHVELPVKRSIPAQQVAEAPVAGGPWVAAEGAGAGVLAQPAVAAEPAEQQPAKVPAAQPAAAAVDIASAGSAPEPEVPIPAPEVVAPAQAAGQVPPVVPEAVPVPQPAASGPGSATPAHGSAVPTDELDELADLDRAPIQPQSRTDAFLADEAAVQVRSGEMAQPTALGVPEALELQPARAPVAASAIEVSVVEGPVAVEALGGAERLTAEVPVGAAFSAAPQPAVEPHPAVEPEAVAVEAGQPAADADVPQVLVPPTAVDEHSAGPNPPAASSEQPSQDPAQEFKRPAKAGPPAPPYEDAVREAVHRVIRERRDIRNGFRPDPIPHDVLIRVLEAAHTAPSVGHSQPWDFVVIRSAATREKMHALAMKQRDAYAQSLPKARAKQFRELKIEAILDTPVNIVVTADPTRGGRHTLGRHTQPQMAPYSSALAVENLWLAARAEGLGVGWVSFFDEREMVRELGLPEHLEVVAYLCVGYVEEFPTDPELMQAGWSKRRPLSWVVHEEEYGRRALPGEEPHDLIDETLRGIRPLDAKALGEAWERQKRMTKPAGALGMLEIISAQLCGLSRQCPPPIPEPAAVAIFAGDHGVHAQGVTAWPQEVTAQMVANFLAGGAVSNAFANQVGAEVCVVDVGVAAELPTTPGLLPRKVRHGTGDFTTGPAMAREDVLRAIEVGIETARDLMAAGNKALLTGEMGIANTTASAALISVFTGADPSEVTGRGTGINDEMHARKVEVVRRALELHQPDAADPIGALSAVGGLEHAAMVGLILGGASLRTPVILDGVSAGAAALVARAIAPEALAACIAGHRSAEPGHVAALIRLGLRPLVDLDLRLGEGTGALLALPLVQSAARVMHEVATFDAAGVTEKS